MVRHTQECRQRGIPFAADPSQQLAWSDGPMIRRLVDGATYLFSNDYEAALISQKTGWNDDEILVRVGTRITTHGKDGIVITSKDADPIRVPVVNTDAVEDPTGVGDAFRAGYLAGTAWGLGLERSAQVGALLATHVLETVGTQEYELRRSAVLERFATTYGAVAAAELEPHLSGLTD
jgi:adenosine kinase